MFLILSSFTKYSKSMYDLLTMVLALIFELQNISLLTEQRLRSALTSFGLWPRSRCSETKEFLKPFEN